MKVHAGSQVAAHEAFSRWTAEGKQALRALQEWGGTVSLYHSLAGDFEGLMDAASWWALAPRRMQQEAPELYEAVTHWLSR